MMLAYDPLRLASLLVQMRGAIESARRMHSGDPMAADALRAVRRAVGAVAHTWAPVVRSILAGDPLAAGVEVLRLDADGVRAFATRLAGLDHEQLLDDAERMGEFTAMLQMLDAHPALARDLADDLDGWVALCDQLAHSYDLFLDDSPTAAVAAARARLVGALAAVVGDDLQRLDLLTPYAAALLVPHLDLHGVQLAEVAHRIVARWCDDMHSSLQAPLPADVVLPLLLTDPVACTEYVRLAGAQPATLFQASSNADVVHRVVLTAIDPARVDAEQAGELLVPLFEWYADGNRPLEYTAVDDPPWRLLLADLLTPWLLHLSPLDGTWALAVDDKRRYLQLLVADDAALARLVADTDAVRAGLTRSLLRDGVVDQRAFAALIGMLSELTIHRRYADEQARAEGHTLLMTAITTVATLPLSTAGGLVVGAGAEVVGGFAPFDPARAARDEEYVQTYSRVLIGAAYLHALYGHWQREGTLPAGVPPPPMPDPDAEWPMGDFHRRLEGWLHTLPGGAAGARGQQVVAVVGPWVNAVDVGEEAGRG